MSPAIVTLLLFILVEHGHSACQNYVCILAWNIEGCGENCMYIELVLHFVLDDYFNLIVKDNCLFI